MTTYMHYATLLEASAALRARKVSAVELTRALLDRIAKIDPSLHSYATVTPDLALRQAEAADAEIAAGDDRGPLHGVPIAVKDICNTAGIVTAAGMTIHADHVPDHDSTVVKRLRDAGAVLLGKLQNTEGAFVSHHPKISPPRNPWNSDYYAGASSSGSGVATAAGLCFGALGSDTGGSIRFPSAANGISGLKPTWGRVSRYGVFALAESLDHIGPMARSAADAGVMLGAIAGRDSNDPTTLSAPVPDYLGEIETGIRAVRIGIDAAYNETGCDAVTVTAVREARRVFETLGANVKEVTLPDPSGVMVTTAWGTICAPETAIAHKATYPARSSEYGGLRNLIEAGRAATGMEVMEAHHKRLAFTGNLAALFTEIDLLLIPTQTRADFTLAQEQELFATAEGLSDFIRFATPFDMSGNPTITLPGGFSPKGLPLSFQLVSRPLDEALLVRAGHAYQQVTDWHHRHPPV
ncbi:amidase [Bradyrhizobium sp. USDA 4473]